MNEIVDDFRAQADFFKALSHPVRLCIIANLASGGEKCINEMQSCLEVSQPLVSQHIKVLKNCGIISMRKDGNNRYYSISNKKVLDIINVF